MTREDQPLDWATDEIMSPADTIMWRGDTDRRMRGTVCMVETLDRQPDWDRLVAAHDWGSRMAPRFRSRVVDSVLGAGTPGWAIDPEFDLHYHLRRVHVGGDGSWRELFAHAEQLAMTPLDPLRPPWEAVLFEGLPDGKAAYMLKAHHALSDGLGAIEGLAQLHSRTRRPDRKKPQPPLPTPETPSSMSLVTQQVMRDLGRAPAVLDMAGRAARASTRPRSALKSSLRLARSAAKVAGLTSPSGSPLLRERSNSWRFSAFDMPFADLRTAAKAAGGSLNDAYLAGLLGALRLYHERMGQPAGTIPTAIPISVRRSGDASAGNRIAVGRLAGPAAIEDPLERILTVREQVRQAQGEPALDLFNTVSPVLAWMRPEALTWLGGATAINDMQASNVPGIPFDVYLAGAKVERMYPFGPLPGCAVMATLMTHGPTSCLGLNTDATAVTDLDAFAESVIEGFAEVLALGPGGSPHRVE